MRRTCLTTILECMKPNSRSKNMQINYIRRRQTHNMISTGRPASMIEPLPAAKVPTRGQALAEQPVYRYRRRGDTSSASRG